MARHALRERESRTQMPLFPAAVPGTPATPTRLSGSAPRGECEPAVQGRAVHVGCASRPGRVQPGSIACVDHGAHVGPGKPAASSASGGGPAPPALERICQCGWLPRPRKVSLSSPIPMSSVDMKLLRIGLSITRSGAEGLLGLRSPLGPRFPRFV